MTSTKRSRGPGQNVHEKLAHLNSVMVFAIEMSRQSASNWILETVQMCLTVNHLPLDKHLIGLDIPGRYLTLIYKRDTICDFLFAFILYISASEKLSRLKRMNILEFWSRPLFSRGQYQL